MCVISKHCILFKCILFINFNFIFIFYRRWWFWLIPWREESGQVCFIVVAMNYVYPTSILFLCRGRRGRGRRNMVHYRDLDAPDEDY